MSTTFVTTEKAAEITGLSVETLRRFRRTGTTSSGQSTPRYVRIGRCIRYSTEELLRWMKSNERASTAEEATIAGRMSGAREVRS